MTAEQLGTNREKYADFVGPSDKDHLGSLLVLFVDPIWTWRTRSRSRYLLSQMNDHTLKDIGLTRADVFWECDKPFWRE